MNKMYDYRIKRDEWGVPHIWGKTDADAVYGLAMARAQDQFDTIQEGYMIIRGRMAEIKGMNGIGSDIIVFLIQAEKIIRETWQEQITPAFKKILRAGIQGLNDYALANSPLIKYKNLFPISETDVLKGYILVQTFTSGAIYALGKVAGNKMDKIPSGSNSFCFSGNKMDDGIPTLISNVHQPVDGPWAFYEAHLCSDEGWNILGATFTPGITPFFGTTPHHAWTPTNNYANFADIFQLELHPENKLQYLMDNSFEMLQPLNFRTRVKLGPFKVPFFKKYYWSKYGITVKNNNGAFAVRFSSRYAVKAAEQYYWMGKAKNLTEFKKALQIQGLASQNLLYLDRENNQFFISNGLFPYRNDEFNHFNIKPGNTLKSLWKPIFHPIRDLPQIENPGCGILYNTNNPPFFATQPGENLKPEDFDSTFGFVLKESNRGLRVRELLHSVESRKVTFKEVVKWKYDHQFAKDSFYTFVLENLDELLNICETKYPDLMDGLTIIKKWNRRADLDNSQASLFALLCYYLVKYIDSNFKLAQCNLIPEAIFVKCFRQARKHILRHFGSLEVPLRDIQFLVKDQTELPIPGLPENIAATFCTKHVNGKLKMEIGDSYILIVRFNQSNVEIESVVPFGASNNPQSPHYADQMSLFASGRRKRMDLNFFEKK